MPNAIKPRNIFITAEGVDPPVMRIAAGQDVTFVNQDSVSHNLSPYGVFVNSGQSVSHTFPVVGTFLYAVDMRFTGKIEVS